MTTPIRLGLVGLGKIACDQHLPAIQKSPDFTLAFAVDPASEAEVSVPHFRNIEDALGAGIPFDAVAVCTPPQPRMLLCDMLMKYPVALLLEKPPAASLAAAQSIADLASARGRPVFAAWHSRYSPYIAAAKAWVQTHQLRSGTIEWRENARKWHPGQGWLWQAGGFGVFDPGINALSILTALYPTHWAVRSSALSVPENADTPVAANFLLSSGEASVSCAFEFHAREDEIWSIRLEATNGDILELSEGGAAISFGDGVFRYESPAEYDGVYAAFAGVVRTQQSEFDLAPLAIVDEALRIAEFTPASAIDI